MWNKTVLLQLLLTIALINSQTYPNCTAYSDFLGDGDCNDLYGYNTADCGWDGGDCCMATNSKLHDDDECLDPAYSKYPNCDVPWRNKIGDGNCDDIFSGYNTEDCGWDGGDCLDPSSNNSSTTTSTTSTTSTSKSSISTPATCDAAADRIGDGDCDDFWGYNTADCGWDGGDCCMATNADLWDDDDCLDPTYNDYPNCDVTWRDRIGDGECDNFFSGYNTEDCGWDGGDCCVPTNPKLADNDDCLDPLYSNSTCITKEGEIVQVDNPLQKQSALVYIFLALFGIIFISPLWYFAHKYKIKQPDNGINWDVCYWTNKFFDIIDENGVKYKFCHYWKLQHALPRLGPCCKPQKLIEMKNISLVWAAFIFDNVVAFSCSILFASISTAYSTVKCVSSSGESSTATETDEGGFSDTLMDSITVWLIATIYGFFIGKIVDTEFNGQKYKRYAFCLLMGIAVLFCVLTIGIRSIFDGLDWEIDQYLDVWALSRGQGWVLADNGIIIVKWLVGKCLIEESANGYVENNKVAKYQLMDDDDFNL